MTKFREKYRNIDVLLIDDIQFIIGKESTQEEFFHTFNALHSAKKQIIISSDKPPKDMEILEDRIRSRFEWGLLADISSPDYETRVAILRKKEEMDGYNLDDSIIEYIAKNIKSNIRELEGSLNKIIAYANLEKREVTMELAETVLKDIISPNDKKIITLNLTKRSLFCTHAGYHNNIKPSTKYILMQPVTFSYQSAEPVAHYTVAHFFTDGDSDSVFPQLILSCIHD